jgi:hypothetical protein
MPEILTRLWRYLKRRPRPSCQPLVSLYLGRYYEEGRTDG